MKRWLFAAVVLQCVAMTTSALACDGQAGKVIYDDNFADDSGGWDLTPPTVVIKPPNLIIDLSSKKGSANAQVLTFHAKEADFCVQGALPKPIAADNQIYLGIEFWAVDYSNYWLAQLASDGGFGLWQRANGSWQSILSVPNAPGFKADGPNALRVKAVGGKISIFLNGQAVKAVRAQMPDGDLRFGVYGQVDKAVDTAPPILVSGYTVTSGQ
jgi:hypothetical protein